MSTQTIEFKKRFLYKDEGVIKNVKRQNETWASYLENGLKEAEKLFREPLTKKERIQILKRGWVVVEELLRAKSQFPNAKVETLLELEGKSGAVAKESLEFAPSRYAAMSYILEGSNVTVDPKSMEKAELDNTHYTQSEKQNKALEIATVICEKLEELIELNIYDSGHRTNFANTLNRLIDVSFDPESGRSLFPDPRKIKQL